MSILKVKTMHKGSTSFARIMEKKAVVAFIDQPASFISVNAVKPTGRKRDLCEIEVMHEGTHFVGKMDELEKAISLQKQFPNGFDDWQETHYFIIQRLQEIIDEGKVCEPVWGVYNNFGTGGMMLMAKQLTDIFENRHIDVEWGKDDDTQYEDKMDDLFEEICHEDTVYCHICGKICLPEDEAYGSCKTGKPICYEHAKWNSEMNGYEEA